MTQFHFVADCHIGNHTVFGGPVIAGINDRCRWALGALAHAARIAKAADSTLVIAGDLFDTSEPLPQHIAEVQRILEPLAEVVILRGNHDMVSERRGDHALGPLEALTNVIVATDPMAVRVDDTALLCVPFQTGDAREWFPDAVRRAAEDNLADGALHRVLAFHLGVVDDGTPAYLREAHDAIPLSLLSEALTTHRISAAFCGNWHNAREWSLKDGRRVVQIGATAPTGFDNAGWGYGKVRAYSPASHPHVITTELVGPRFFNATTLAEVEAAVDRQSVAAPRFFSLRGEVATQVEGVRVMPGVAGARALADQTEVRAATRDAAVAVRQEATLDAALAAYVEKMPVDNGVDRARVLAMARKYLGKGAA